MISEIVAVAKDWGIGKNNGLLFNLKGDMDFFRKTTKGHVVVMGYNTYLSIGKPLPNRINVVLYDKAPLIVETKGDVIFINNFNVLLDFVRILSKELEVFIIGGASVYSLFLPHADKLYITKVDAEDKEATAFFPNIDEHPEFEETWKSAQYSEYDARTNKDYTYRFTEFERIK